MLGFSQVRSLELGFNHKLDFRRVGTANDDVGLGWHLLVKDTPSVQGRRNRSERLNSAIAFVHFCNLTSDLTASPPPQIPAHPAQSKPGAGARFSVPDRSAFPAIAPASRWYAESRTARETSPA